MQAEVAFHDLARQKLGELISTHSPAILEEPERVEAWLRYSCPEQKREVNVLLASLGQKVPQDLLASGDEMGLFQRLVDDLAMDRDAAWWAVETWASALGSVAQASTSMAEAVRVVDPATIGRDPSRREPSPLGGDQIPESVQRELLTKHLEEVARGHEVVKEESDRDGSGNVFAGGIFFSVLLGGAAYVWTTNSSKQNESLLVVLIAVAVVVSFALSYFWHQHDKREKVDAAKKKVDVLIAKIVDAFPKAIHAWGGPAFLNNPEAAQQLLCAVKADHLPVAPQPASRAVGTLSNHYQAPAAPFSPPTSRQPTISCAPHRGGVVLTLGILGWVIPLLAIIAWVMGHGDLEAMKTGKMDRSGQSQTESGRTLGMIASCVYGGLLLLACLAGTSK